MYEPTRTLNDVTDVRSELGDIAVEADKAFDADEDRQYIAERLMFRLIGVLDAWPQSAVVSAAPEATEDSE